MTLRRGKFLTLEGVDGAGKSTHVPWLIDTLTQHGLQVLSTREPGGTPIGETLREILLHTPMQLECETLLMFAARAEHLRTVIEPSLEAGIWVVCDRFTDATYAYQGGGRALGVERVAVLEQWLHAACQPDCTWLFDVPLEVARERLNRTRDQDRFEQLDDAFFERTRAVYLSRAEQDRSRIRRIDSNRPVEQIRAELSLHIEALLATGQPV